MPKLILLSVVCLSIAGCTAEDREFIGRLGDGLSAAGGSLQASQQPVYDPQPMPHLGPYVYNCQRWANGDVTCNPR